MAKKGILILGLPLVWLFLFGLACGGDDDDSNNNNKNNNDDDENPADTPYVPDPFINAAGFGVCDLEASIAFYTDGMGMVVQGERDTPYYHEVTLSSPGDEGYSLVLMDLDDDSDECGYNPDKVVFVVPNVEAARTVALEKGGEATPKLDPEATDITEYPVERNGETVTVRVAMIFDPDRYLVEMVEVTSASNNYFSGFGIGVADLEQAKAFYIDVVGMELNYELQIPGFMDESILRSPREIGLEVVLMQYDPVFDKNYNDLPVKLVFTVSDAAGFADRIAEKNADLIIEKPTHANDMYGYLLEIVEE